MITIVHADDWMAVYDADGHCRYQGHSISNADLLDIAGVAHRHAWAQGQADDDGQFPSRVEDVRLDEGEVWE